MRGIACLLALVAVGPACGRERPGRSRAESPPPDLAGAKTGGAAAARAMPAFGYVPHEALAVGIVDPSQVFGVTEWIARAPALVKAIPELRIAGYDPAKTRFVFFSVREPAGSLSSVVVGEGTLEGVAGARRERREDVDLGHFDGAGVGIAWAKGVTLVGRRAALALALAAGTRKEQRLVGGEAFTPYREILDRLPAWAAFRLVVRAPLLAAFAQRSAAAGVPPAIGATLSRLRGADAAGIAAYAHGSAVRLALVVRTSGEDAARALAEDAHRAVAASRLPPGRIPRRPGAMLLEVALAATSVERRGPYVFVESAIPADLVVEILRVP